MDNSKEIIGKKKELYRLVVARSDIAAAMHASELIIKHVDGLGHDLYIPLFHAAAIAYGRPFSANEPVGALPSKWQKFSDQRLQNTHDKLIEARNKFIAHSDEEVRHVEIYPPGAPMGKTDMRAQGLSVAIRTLAFPIDSFKNVWDTCMNLGKRIDASANELLEELYGGRTLEPKPIRLVFDESL